MNLLVLKGFLGATTAGIVAASGFGIYKLASGEGKTIGDDLPEGKRWLLTNKSDDDAKWKEKAVAYGSRSTNNKPALDGYNHNSSDGSEHQTNIKNMKSSCEALLLIKLNDPKIGNKQAQAKEWCLVDKV